MSAEFEVVVEAEHLCLNQIPDRNQERHDIILSLMWHGYTAAEIAAYLNKHGYKTPRGRVYYPKLIGATVSKLKRRKSRRLNTTFRMSEITYWLNDY